MPDEKTQTQAEPGKLVPFQPKVSHQGPGFAKEMFPNDDTVTVVFPKAMLLTLTDHRQVRFISGPQELPLTDEFFPNGEIHWYLKAAGVKLYKDAERENSGKLIRPPENRTPLRDDEKPIEVTFEHVAFLRSEGYSFPAMVQVQNFVDRFNKDEKTKFLAAFEEWRNEQGKVTQAEPDEQVSKPFEDMTKAELQQVAAERFKLTLPGNWKKEEMIEKLYELSEK